jgi:hypothetical protein
MLGLVFDGSNFIPHPNYSLATKDVYKEFLLALFENGYPLDFIYLRSASRRVDSALPSWIVDWSDLGDPLARMYFRYMMNIKLASPAEERDPLAVAGDTLTLSGSILGTIHYLSSSALRSEGVGGTGDRISLSSWYTENRTSDIFQELASHAEVELSGAEHIYLQAGAHPVNLSSSFKPHVAKFVTYGMRLALVKSGRSVHWVHPQSREGDMIARIYACRGMLVVRRKGSRGYRVVGMATWDENAIQDLVTTELHIL